LVEICTDDIANNVLLKSSKSVVFEMEIIYHPELIQRVTIFHPSGDGGNFKTLYAPGNVAGVIESNVFDSAYKSF